MNLLGNIRRNFAVIKKIGIMAGILMLLILSCGNSKGNGEEKKSDIGKIKIVTTTTMLTDLVKTIGGDKVEVSGLMGEGVDPHLYIAGAGDIKKLTEADIVIYGGLHLEGKMTEIFEKMEKENKKIINVGDKLDKSKIVMEEENVPDPHVWFDTELWKNEAEIVAAELSKINEENSAYYMENLQKYKMELDELTSYIKSRINEIPEKSRVLVTAHDAFGYFGKQFGLEVKAIQGVSTDSETGTKNINDLADFIVKRDIKAIFVESSVPKKSIEALQEAVKSKGKEVKIGGELYSDSLGDKEHNTETYIKTVKANADTIVNALK